MTLTAEVKSKNWPSKIFEAMLWNLIFHDPYCGGKIEELAHELDHYRYNILGICELRWKGLGETTTEKGRNLYFSGRDDRHEHGVGFLVHKDILATVMSCRPVSSRLITIRMRAAPFNITIIQAYAPTSDYDDSEVEDVFL